MSPSITQSRNGSAGTAAWINRPSQIPEWAPTTTVSTGWRAAKANGPRAASAQTAVALPGSAVNHDQEATPDTAIKANQISTFLLHNTLAATDFSASLKRPNKPAAKMAPAMSARPEFASPKNMVSCIVSAMTSADVSSAPMSAAKQ